MVGNGAHLLLPVVDVTVVGGSGMGVVHCHLSLMVVLVGVGVVVVVKERGNVTMCNTSVTFALC